MKIAPDSMVTTRLYGDDWQGKMREKLETQFATLDLSFLMGTVHRFPDQWLIVGLVYPKKKAPLLGSDSITQPGLFD